MQSLCIELTEAVYNVSAFVNPFSLTQGILTNHTITNHEDSFIIELQTNTKLKYMNHLLSSLPTDGYKCKVDIIPSKFKISNQKATQ